jgi:BlaI family transcriptional regulator, penicillinase repressor
VASPKLTPLELQIMEVLWTRGPSAVREVQEGFPEESRPAYTTIQTVMYRLETKKVARRTHKIGNAHIFEATVARAAAQRRLINDVLNLFGGKAQPMMAHLIQMGELTLDDVREAERLLLEAEKKDKP